MSERDELARVVYDSFDAIDDPSETRDTTAIITDAILAAGYRKVRVVTTMDELEALPLDSVVFSQTVAYQNYGDGMWAADGRFFQTQQVELPATVLYEPQP